jgi:hypothetical protein
MRLAAFVLPVLAAVLLGSPLAADEVAPERPAIYKWVDENGIAHYTTDRKRIPSNLRNRIRDADSIRAEQAAPAAASRARAQDAARTDAGLARPAPKSDEVWAVRDEGTGSEAESVARGGFTESGDPDGSAAPIPEDPATRAERADLDNRIATLEQELARDEERLKQLISDARPEAEQPVPLYRDPELEEIATRFPQIQADLAALRARRRSLDLPTGTN